MPFKDLALALTGADEGLSDIKESETICHHPVCFKMDDIG
jgi:hypothetical protein